VPLPFTHALRITRLPTNFASKVSRFLALDDKRSLARALYYMGTICIAIHDYLRAKTALEESISICRGIHFPQQLNMAMTSLGQALDEQGEHEHALVTTKEALAIAEQNNDIWGMIHALQQLGTINRYIGEHDIAINYFERSLTAIRLIGDRLAKASFRIYPSSITEKTTQTRKQPKAFALFQESEMNQQPFPLRMMGYWPFMPELIRPRDHGEFARNRDQGHISGQLVCLVALGTCESVEGNVQKAVTLATLVDHQLHTEPYVLMEPDTAALNHLLVTGNEKLSKELLEQTRIKGRTLRIEDVVAQELPSAG
jgi:hypothetical protein